MKERKNERKKITKKKQSFAKSAETNLRNLKKMNLETKIIWRQVQNGPNS